MGLQDNAEALIEQKSGPRVRRCKAVWIVDELPAGDREYYFTRVLPNEKAFPGGDVTSLLSAEGLDCSRSTINSHRAGTCGCTPAVRTAR